MKKDTVNIVSNSTDHKAASLSNLAILGFELTWPDWKSENGQPLVEHLYSVEGPLQALRFDPASIITEGSTPDKNVWRRDIAHSFGIPAWRYGRVGQRDLVYLMPFSLKESGPDIKYDHYYEAPFKYQKSQADFDALVHPFGSPEHRQFIIRLLWAKFTSCEWARDALVSTQGLTLIHETGEPEHPQTSLTADDFCRTLETIRAYLIHRGK